MTSLFPSTQKRHAFSLRDYRPVPLWAIDLIIATMPISHHATLSIPADGFALSPHYCYRPLLEMTLLAAINAPIPPLRWPLSGHVGAIFNAFAFDFASTYFTPQKMPLYDSRFHDSPSTRWAPRLGFRIIHAACRFCRKFPPFLATFV